MSPKPEAPRATHTPGPWFLYRVGAKLSARYDVMAGAAPNQQHVVTLYLYDNNESGPVEADARLIAAAPDLLAACKCALERIQDGAMEQTNEHGQSTQRAERVTADTVAWLKAAIAKAEGSA